MTPIGTSWASGSWAPPAWADDAWADAPVPLTTGIRMLQTGEQNKKDVLNRPMEDVLTGSGYLADGSDFAGFATRNVTLEVSAQMPNVRAAPYLAVGDGITNDDTAVNAAIAAAASTTPQGRVWLPTGNYLVTALVNTNGVQFEGPGRILKTITGGTQQLTRYVDRHQRSFGAEYLVLFWTKLIAGTACNAVMTGDSTVAGTGVTAPYIPSTLLDNLTKSAGATNITWYNRGQPGKNSEDWLTTYLGGDLTVAGAAPDLLIVRWGINDAYIPTGARTLAQFTTSMRTALASIRASHGVAAMSILLMSPNALANTPSGPDEKWNEQISDALRQMARDYSCAFYDTYAPFADARTMAGIGWDSISTHPGDMINAAIWADVARFLCQPGTALPGGFRPYSGASRTRTSTSAVTTYGSGAQLDRASKVIDPFWPYDGAVMTIRQPDGTYAMQFNWNYQTTFLTSYAYRTGTASGWNPWKYLPAGPESNTNSVLTLINSWVMFATDTRHVTFPGVADGTRVTTPDNAAISITGDLDLRAQVAANDWTPTANNMVISKFHADGTSSYDFFISNTTGNLVYRWTPNGTYASQIVKTSSVATGLTDGSTKWVRVTHDVDNGAAGNDVKFYLQTAPSVGAGTLTITGGLGAGTFTTSQAGLLAVGDMLTVNAVDYLVKVFNGTTGVTLDRAPNVAGASFSILTWTQLGTTQTTAGIASIFDSTDHLELGANGNGLNVPFAGTFYRADVLSGINGTLKATFNPIADAADGAVTVTASTGEVWTLSGLAVYEELARAIKEPSGMVQLSGSIKSGTTTAATIITTLPVGYRPPSGRWFSCLTNTNGDPATIEVTSTGAVTIQYTPSAGRLALDGIQFMAS